MLMVTCASCNKRTGRQQAANYEESLKMLIIWQAMDAAAEGSHMSCIHPLRDMSCALLGFWCLGYDNETVF